MKKLILLLSILAFTIGMNAQNETFTYPNNVGDELRGQYIVIDEKGTAQENYSKVINYINKSYNTPSEVINSQIEGKYTRIEGVSKMFKGAGTTYHTIEFNFKQDKIQVKLLNLETRYRGTVQSTIAYSTYDATHKSSGEVKNSKMNIAIKIVNGVNKLTEGIKTGIAQESSETPDDDW